MNQVISIQNLVPGMMIVRIVSQTGRIHIKKSGLVSSNEMIQGLKEMGVAELEIDPLQQVEIASVQDMGSTSITQSLLRGDFDLGSSAAVSNPPDVQRNLFVPSSQNIPNWFQRNRRQLLTMLVLAVCGFLLGVFGVKLQQYVNSSQYQKVESLIPEQQKPDQQSIPNTTSPQSTSVVNNESVPTVAESEVSTKVVQDLVNESESLTPQPPTNDEIEPNEVASFESSSESKTLSELSFGSSEDSQESKPNTHSTLLDKVNKAIEEVNKEAIQESNIVEPSVDDEANVNNFTVNSNLQTVDDLPAVVLTQLPRLVFSTHMYASEPENRWVRVNGEKLYEGDWITEELQLTGIEADHVVLTFGGEVFSMPALTDW